MLLVSNNFRHTNCKNGCSSSDCSFYDSRMRYDGWRIFNSACLLLLFLHHVAILLSGSSSCSSRK
ncbi:hypothetical protein T11_4621 [Trichinella zimbabwensis]|uniref:Uncharacterized protein n=1 Tax=Trichinella zimbabwensis TaxID=268475 RepID=A0A0V1HFB1_9BILA|nr:hypothetical protein T11_4621 [Trichinella zimbabwensis]